MSGTASMSPLGIRSFRSAFATYRELSKSGIVALVLISVLGGYWVGQSPEAPIDLLRMLMTLCGVLGLASGSSALNQLQEVEIDASMPRTAKRPLPSGRITRSDAWIFIFTMFAIGIGLLAAVGGQVLALGLAAAISYNGLYTLWWKKHWAYAAVPGAIPGALPILIGYAAASGDALAPAGIYLFFVLFYWQMPHFWVLALRFKKDYALGQVPTLPVARGDGVTVFQIVLWCLAYVALALIAPLFLKTGAVYTAVALPVCGMILWELRSFARASGDPQSKGWLRFFLWINFSLILFIGAAVLDLWSVHLFAPFLIR